jgi:excinuclease ABC subunit A
MAPLVNARKGHYKELFETIRKKGFFHVRVDGEVREIVAGMKLDRYKTHTIEVVVDRLKPKADEEADLRRLRQSVDRAMTQGDGIMMIIEAGSETANAAGPATPVRYFSRNLMCPETGLSYQNPAPHTFSFNSPSGWCPCCKGLGRVKGDEVRADNDEIDEAIQQDNWWERLTEFTDTEEEENEEWIECPECHGKRLSKEALSYKFGKYSISDLANMDIDELLKVLDDIKDNNELTSVQKSIAEPILKEIIGRLRFMQSVGLSYLNLNRSSESLSGGESQRIRLATQIGSRLVNVLYILDEPSIGLHQRDNERLISSLKELRDIGNSVIVVEHDEQMMREADWIVDIGPKAGRLGGNVLFSGTPDDLLKTDTLTAKYLKGEVEIPEYRDTGKPDKSDKWITLSGCTGNNLKHVTARIPLGKMVCVTGVSGSGKSTLINQTLYPILSQRFYRSKQAPLPYKSIEGVEHIDKVINVDQSPIGRTPRSNPATYTNVFNDIRDLFAALPESKIRGWKTGRFSFNMSGGRCDECLGNGYKTIQMHFMPDVYVPCEICGGQRYNRETLEVRWKGKNIADVLDMTVNQAVEFFEPQPKILRKIKTIQDVGLGYIKLGQSSTSLSGGESQRIKLATELSRPSTGKTLYILDEPTTGLHFEDIRVLLGVLRQLVNKGNTVIIIEHNTDVIRACDWIIDLGPEGGRGGGQIVAEGTVEDIRANKKSLTGRFI